MCVSNVILCNRCSLQYIRYPTLNNLLPFTYTSNKCNLYFVLNATHKEIFSSLGQYISCFRLKVSVVGDVPICRTTKIAESAVEQSYSLDICRSPQLNNWTSKPNLAKIYNFTRNLFNLLNIKNRIQDKHGPTK